jgi:sugar O-acyltransferase (sialic acid O-acetyltransferase NeuD family)
MNKKKIALIGYGNLGIQIHHMLIQNQYKDCEFVYFDDIIYKNKDRNSFPFNQYISDKFDDCEFIVCLGYKWLRLKNEIITQLKEKKRRLLTFIHPTSFINPTAMIGDGVIIYPKCNVDYKVTIGDGCLLNNSCTVSHETNLDSCCFIAPGVVISGFVKIGENVFIGSGSVISNNILIEENCIIGIGSLITKNVAKNNSVIGNPQKVLQKRLELK